MRAILLKTHLVLGLLSALLLIILGLTGAVIAFENDIEHWVNPSAWYVDSKSKPIEIQALVEAIEKQTAPAAARVVTIRFPRQDNLAYWTLLSDGSVATVNPATGAILSRSTKPSRTSEWIGALHQIHLRLAPNPRATPGWAAIGKVIVSYAGLCLVLLVPTGIVLWWRGKRAKLRWQGPWQRFTYEAHQVVGIYSALFLLLASFTGVLIGFDWGEKTIYAVTGSERPKRGSLPQVPTPPEAAVALPAGKLLDIARSALPGFTIAALNRPRNAGQPAVVEMRSEETSEAVHSSVVINPFSGAVLEVHNFLTDSPGYRMIRFNRSLHTGDVLGTPTHILMSLSSLLLVGMAISGVLIWWKKLS